MTLAHLAPVLGPAMQRTRKDKVAVLLAKATACGVHFRFSGATLQVTGADTLHPDDGALLERYIADIRGRLEPSVVASRWRAWRTAPSVVVFVSLRSQRICLASSYRRTSR
jgi:hypothetical protein